MLNELAETLKSKNIKLSYSSNAAEYIAANSFSQKFGARNMRRYIQTNVEDRLAELIISDYKHSITQVMISAKDGKLNISCM
jgi:ATP-dependent Clp protease ATP-binding subunit ClpA